MSRSRRKNPIGGITSAPSEKDFKKSTNGAFRAAQKKVMDKIEDGEIEDVKLPRKPRDVVNPWLGPKDGKSYFGDLKKKDPKAYKKYMRK